MSKKHKMKPKKKSFAKTYLKTSSPFSRAILTISVIIFGALGYYLIFQSRGATPPDNAARMMMWVDIWDCLSYTNDQLDTFAKNGVGGFLCKTKVLKSLGGSSNAGFNSDPGYVAPPGIQREIERESYAQIKKIKNAGMKVYLEFHLTDSGKPTGTVTPDYWDDARWDTMLNEVGHLSKVAYRAGFDGINSDMESVTEENTGDWRVSYRGNTHSPEETRKKVKERGKKLMQTMSDNFPNLNYLMNYMRIPGDWNNVVQNVYVNPNNPDDVPKPEDDIANGQVLADWLDGLTSYTGSPGKPGYNSITIVDHTFYKGAHITSNFDAAFQHNLGRIYDWMSNNFERWDYAAPRVGFSPFIWMDGFGPQNRSSYPLTPEQAAVLTPKYAKWGMNGIYADFLYKNVFQGEAKFSQANWDNLLRYLPGVKKSAETRNVDNETPTLAVDIGAKVSDSKLNLKGNTHDNLAIRHVSWENKTNGAKGEAKMTWEHTGNRDDGYNWNMRWTANDIPAQAGHKLVITSHDIKDLSKGCEITIDNQGNAVLGSCDVAPPNNPPAVSLTAPTNNATFTAPATVNITANASDSDGNVSKVEFFQGTTKLAEKTAAPYSFSWTNVPVGNYSITAKATDDKGVANTSGAINIKVNSPTNNPPTVSLTAPINNAQFTAPATVAISANASDSDGSISKVEFFNGSTKLGDDTSSPYTFSWTNVTAGTYSVTAKATDNGGAATSSALVSVSVNPPGNQPPTVRLHIPILAPLPGLGGGYTSGTSISMTANATDPDGTVTKVEYFQGTTKIGESTTSPYLFTWNNVRAGNYNFTARATDDDGASTTSASITIVVAYKRGDLDRDDKIDNRDLDFIFRKWRRPATPDEGDLSGDGNITLLDLSMLLKEWGR